MNIQLIYILLISSILYAYDIHALNYNEVETLRSTYYLGVEDEDYIDSLEVLVESIFGSDTSKYSALGFAYLGGINALKSKHAFWPFTKMNYLNDSMEHFAKAIKKDSKNLEIRFMRFSILYYVPGILGYGEEQEEDLKVIYDLLISKNYPDNNPEIIKGIIQFVIDSDLLSDKLSLELQGKLQKAQMDG